MNLLIQKVKANRWIFITAGLVMIGSLCNTVCIQAQSNSAGKTVDQKKFQQLIDKKKTVLLDVRTVDEYKSGHIPNATQIDVLNKEDFKNQVAKLDRKKTYLLYCRSGKRSNEAKILMKEMGFKKIIDLKGGFSNWNGPRE